MIQIPRASVMSIARARARYASLFSNFFVGTLVRAPALTLVVLIVLIDIADARCDIARHVLQGVSRARDDSREESRGGARRGAAKFKNASGFARDAETALGGVFERARVERAPDDGKSVDAAVAAVAAESTAAASVRGITADASSVERARCHALGFATEIGRRRWTRAR